MRHSDHKTSERETHRHRSGSDQSHVKAGSGQSGKSRKPDGLDDDGVQLDLVRWRRSKSCTSVVKAQSRLTTSPGDPCARLCGVDRHRGHAVGEAIELLRGNQILIDTQSGERIVAGEMLISVPPTGDPFIPPVIHRAAKF
jgi:hypothetical protein